MKLHRRGIWLVATLLAMTLIAAGCNGDDGGSATGTADVSGDSNDGGSSATEGEIVIGGMLTLTGQVSTYGADARKAIDLAVDEWNADGGLLGREIRISYEDTAGDPAQTPTVAQKLVNDGVEAVIGPLLSFECLIAQPIFEEADLPSTSGICSVEDLYDQGWEHFFDTFPTEQRGYAYAASRLGDLDLSRLAMIDDDEAYGQAIVAGVRAGMEENNLEEVTALTVQLDQTDFSSELTALRGEDIDAVVCGCFPFLAATIKKQAAALGLDVPFLLPTGSRIDVDVPQIGGEALVGSYHFGSAVPQDLGTDAADQFVAAYTEEKGEGAGRSWNAFWYDAAHALFQAIEAAGSADADAVTAAYHDLEFEGATGTVSFCDTGERAAVQFATHEAVEGDGPGGIEWRQVGDLTRDVVEGCS